jgi:hypothetical protein
MRFEKLTIGSTQLPWPAVAIALAVMPMLAVAGLRTLKRSPASALGAPIAAAAAFKPSVQSTASANASALVSQFNAEASRGFGPSPMINKAPPPPKVQPKVVEQPRVVPKADPEPQPRQPQRLAAPDLQITSIMASQNGSVAVINGKIRRVGDAVGNGYRITVINAATSQVEVANETGDKNVYQFKGNPGE